MLRQIKRARFLVRKPSVERLAGHRFVVSPSGWHRQNNTRTLQVGKPRRTTSCAAGSKGISRLPPSATPVHANRPHQRNRRNYRRGRRGHRSDPRHRKRQLTLKKDRHIAIKFTRRRPARLANLKPSTTIRVLNAGFGSIYWS